MRPAVVQRRATVGAGADDEVTDDVDDEDGDMCRCQVRSATFLCFFFLFFLLPFLFFFKSTEGNGVSKMGYRSLPRINEA